MDENAQEALAEIRTLLALERNYLAEERTALAELRTGLAVALIAPSASAVIAYIVPNITKDETILSFGFLVFLTVLGTWISLTSRTRLKEIREKKKKLKERQANVVSNSRATQDLLKEFLIDEGLKQ
jgi:uncharacterized membrane protein YidH (DUF202 family)